MRNVHPALNGATVRLTLDSDIQWYVQSEVMKAKAASGARSASAVVWRDRLDRDQASGKTTLERGCGPL